MVFDTLSNYGGCPIRYSEAPPYSELATASVTLLFSVNRLAN